MKKDKFVKLMSGFLKMRESEEKLNSAMLEFDHDFGGFSMSGYETLFLQSMSEAMNDDAEWISYWVYDLECGSNAKKMKVTKDKKVVPMETLEDLYNCINN